MNEIQPYEHLLKNKLQELEQPDINLAWAQMDAMLDEEDDDPQPFLLLKRKGCGLIVLALLLFLVGGYAFYRYNTKSTNHVVDGLSTSEINVPDKKGTLPFTNDDSHSSEKVIEAIPNDSIISDLSKINKIDDSIYKQQVQSRTIADRSALQFKPAKASSHGNTQPEDASTSPKKRLLNNKAARRFQLTGEATNVSANKTSDKNRSEITTSQKNHAVVSIDYDTAGPTNSFDVELVQKDPSNTVSPVTNIQGNDSASNKMKTADSLLITKKADTTAVIKKRANEEPEKKTSLWTFTAGLSSYQQLKLNGESSVPFNYYGRKGAFTDYIPSIYVRAFKTDKWFIHAEYRFGAPQYIKSFLYKSVVKDTTPSGNNIRGDYSLQKTYYHQLPLSFNYKVLPGLYVGTGVVIQRFSGAISNERTIAIIGVIDSLISSSIVREGQDDRFTKTNIQWSAELQYQWKKLTLGGRYSRDINPYIRYIDPISGNAMEKRAQSFNVFLRYELWRSRKK